MGRWAIVLMMILLGCQAAARGDEREDWFETKIRPVLSQTCFRCHDATQKAGGLQVDSREALLTGGESGPSVVPGKPEESLLWRALRRESTVSAMPPAKDQALRLDQIADFERWIRDGAVWPKQSARFASQRHWSLMPVVSAVPPSVEDAAWCRTSIDPFIRRRQEELGAAPISPADKRTWIRRATFDLLGLPPTSDAVEAYLTDERPDAAERVIDRLLASPAYGERWGRHWLDVVRYADSAGETADYPLPLAWRYRNYVVRAFNRDKPFDQFVREQIAGDVLARGSTGEKYAEQVTATGYLALSRRFGFDSENYHHLTIQDSIDTLGQSLLGMSLGCARCHDHKFDPVTMRDYYALYGIFDSSRYPFPGSEQKQKVRSLAPLVPPSAAILSWNEYLARVGSLTHELASRQQPTPPGLLRSLLDIDGDFELQAPAAGGSNGVLVPPWHFEGKVSVTTAAQSPFKNLYATGRVGASVAGGTNVYRFFQSLANLDANDSGERRHFNLDLRIGESPANAIGEHRVAFGEPGRAGRWEWIVRPRSLALRCGEVVQELGPLIPNEWINLQWTTDRRTSTVQGRVGKPGAVREFGPLPATANVVERVEWVEFRSESGATGSSSTTDATNAYPPLDVDNLGIRSTPIASVSTVPAEDDESARQLTQWNDEYRALVGIDGDLEMQPRDKAPTAPPWNPGPNSVVKLTASAQSPFRNVYGVGEQGLHLPNRAEYDGFGVTLAGIKSNDTGKSFVSFDFRCVSAAAGGSGSWRFYMGHGPGPTPAIELYWNEREFFRRSGDAKEAVAPIELGRWYQVQLTLDWNSRTYVGVLATPEKQVSFSGQCAPQWDRVIDYAFIDSYGHLPGVRPSLDADNFAFVGQPPAMIGAPATPATALIADRRERISSLRKRIDEHEARLRQSSLELQRLLVEGPFPLAYAMSEGTPHDVAIQQRGEPDRPGAVVPRGVVKALAPPSLAERPADRLTHSGSGRLELANWLTRADHPLTGRVLVNRVWQYHFGRGLVTTPNDFGSRGQPPTHPELLDHLTSEFLRRDWSIKELHRLVMLSATYRQASPTATTATPALASDDARRTYVGFSRRRLSAEEIRDAILFVSERLDTRPAEGHPFPSPITWGYTQHAPFRAVYDHAHRSLYLMSQRIKRHPFLALFDGPDPNASTADRALTTVPTQALYFLNDPFVHESAAQWADRLLEQERDDTRRIDRVWRTAIGRSASSLERQEATDFLDAYRKELSVPAGNAATGAYDRQVWSAYLRTLLGSNEFLYVD